VAGDQQSSDIIHHTLTVLCQQLYQEGCLSFRWQSLQEQGHYS